MYEQLIEDVKGLGIKKRQIELDLKMPLNSLSGMLNGTKIIPHKWATALMDYVNLKSPDSTKKSGFTKKEQQFIETIKQQLDTPEIKAEFKKSFNDLLTKNKSVVKTELVDGSVKVTNNPTMPQGLNWKEQLEWKRNHKK